jgi:hypothetical protein
MGQDPRTRKGVSEPSITPPRFTVKVLVEWAKGSLTADGWIQERPCRVTIDTGASVTVARPDVVAGLPEREFKIMASMSLSMLLFCHVQVMKC